MRQKTASFCTATTNAIITTTTCHLLRIQSPLPACNQMERVVCQVCSDSILVGRVDAGPRPHRSSRVHPEGACLLRGTCNMQPGKEGEESLHATCGTPLYWQTPLSAAKGCKICCPGHLSWSVAAYHCLHNGFAVLGQAGASPIPGQLCHLAGGMQELWCIMKPLVSLGRKRSLQPWHHLTRQKLPHHSQWRPLYSLHRNPRNATPTAPGPIQEDP